MKPELLAPAGDMECLETAFKFGADAVYLGGPFMQLRSKKSTAFTIEDIAEGVKYAHELGKKLYVTVNSFAKDNEFEHIVSYVRQLKEIDVDAVIVSDLGVIQAIHEFVPDMEIHVSTQANCQNGYCAKVYKALGAKRVVLAREMSLDDIADFKKTMPEDMEIEAFVHGAMCMSFSGRCFISTYLTGRSGNRGECTQPCRWRYHLVEESRPNEFFPVEENDNGTTLLSSRDLNCVSFIDKLEELGVCSFKIEGRMKSPYYVATVVNAYRHAIDKTASLDDIQHELNCVSHRPYTSGFYFGELKQYMPDDDMAYKQEKVFAGIVKENGENFIKLEQRNKFTVGDVLEVVSPTSMGLAFEVTSIIDSNGENIDSAPHPKEIVTVNCPYKLAKGDILRKR